MFERLVTTICVAWWIASRLAIFATIVLVYLLAIRDFLTPLAP